MLLKCFVGLELDEEPFVPTVFTESRHRFMGMDVGKKLFDAVVLQASDKGLLGSEHFSVDGSLLGGAGRLRVADLLFDSLHAVGKLGPARIGE